MGTRRRHTPEQIIRKLKATGYKIVPPHSPEAAFLLTLGGDGTTLNAVDHAINHNKPILAASLGKLGFLAQVSPKYAISSVEKALHGKYRSDSRKMICAKAMIRNKSAQSSVRTPASPLCRSMMRPKVFHGTNSMTCANSVLPTFMRHPELFKPASIARTQISDISEQAQLHRVSGTGKRAHGIESEIQIVDTPQTAPTRTSTGLAVFGVSINRTLLRLT